jgi:hypothetical protein
MSNSERLRDVKRLRGVRLGFWFPWGELYLAFGIRARGQAGGFAASGLAFGFPRANFYSAISVL